MQQDLSADELLGGIDSFTVEQRIGVLRAKARRSACRRCHNLDYSRGTSSMVSCGGPVRRLAADQQLGGPQGPPRARACHSGGPGFQSPLEKLTATTRVHPPVQGPCCRRRTGGPAAARNVAQISCSLGGTLESRSWSSERGRTNSRGNSMPQASRPPSSIEMSWQSCSA